MGKLFGSIFWSICQAILKLIENIESAFYLLVGINNTETENGESVNILAGVMNTDAVGNILSIFIIYGASIFLILLIIGIIKAQMNKDVPGIMKKTLANAFKGAIFFVLVPMIVMFALGVCSSLIQMLFNKIAQAAGKSGTSSGIAETLFNLCIETKTNDATYNDSFGILIDKKVNMKLGDGCQFNYFLCILIGCVLLFSLALAVINLAERLINLVILYVVSPVIVATSVTDDGARLNIWKDKIIAKYVGVMGNVLSMYIYFVIVGWCQTFLIGEGFVIFSPKGIAYFAIVIGGAFMACKGSTLIAGLISHNEATQDGLSQGASQRLAGAGLGLAKTALFGGAKVASGIANGAGGTLANGTSAMSGTAYTGVPSGSLARARSGGIVGLAGKAVKGAGSVLGAAAVGLGLANAGSKIASGAKGVASAVGSGAAKVANAAATVVPGGQFVKAGANMVRGNFAKHMEQRKERAITAEANQRISKQQHDSAVRQRMQELKRQNLRNDAFQRQVSQNDTKGVDA